VESKNEFSNSTDTFASDIDDDEGLIFLDALEGISQQSKEFPESDPFQRPVLSWTLESKTARISPQIAAIETTAAIRGSLREYLESVHMNPENIESCISVEILPEDGLPPIIDCELKDASNESILGFSVHFSINSIDGCAEEIRVVRKWGNGLFLQSILQSTRFTSSLSVTWKQISDVESLSSL
jgi:hypothetical protein